MANKINIAGATSGDAIQLANVILEVYSQEILFAAQPTLRFMSVVTKRTELGVMPGKTINFLRYAALGGDSTIEETQVIETDTLTTSVIQISVKEHAKAISQSEFLIRTALTDTLQDAAVALGMHYAVGVDSMIRDVLLTGANVLYANDKVNRAALTAADTFNIDLVRAVVELLAVNKAPKFDADGYICFIHPHQSRFIRRDPAWVQVQLYSTPESIKAGEIGRIEDVRFVETTQIPYVKINTQEIWADNKYTGTNTLQAANTVTNVYRAIVCGDYCVGLAEALPVEMRDDGVHDFGRTRKLAYYGIWGAGLIESGFSCILETA